MPKPIHLFVSSSPDMQAEREIVGQVVAQLPVTLGWRIGHTPRTGVAEEDRALWVEECDLYVLILGQDFAAPMGDELRRVANKGIKPMAYRKVCTPSPSAQNTIRYIALDWHVFNRPDEFRQMLTRDLLHALINQASKLELVLVDLAGLVRLFESLNKRPEQEPGPKQTDAGRGGVILGREVLERQPTD